MDLSFILWVGPLFAHNSFYLYRNQFWFKIKGILWSFILLAKRMSVQPMSLFYTGVFTYCFNNTDNCFYLPMLWDSLSRRAYFGTSYKLTTMLQPWQRVPSPFLPAGGKKSIVTGSSYRILNITISLKTCNVHSLKEIRRVEASRNDRPVSVNLTFLSSLSCFTALLLTLFNVTSN